MTSREDLIKAYMMKQKELASAQEKFTKLKNDKADVEIKLRKSMTQLANLESQSQKIGEVIQVLE